MPGSEPVAGLPTTVHRRQSEIDTTQTGWTPGTRSTLAAARRDAVMGRRPRASPGRAPTQHMSNTETLQLPGPAEPPEGWNWQRKVHPGVILKHTNTHPNTHTPPNARATAVQTGAIRRGLNLRGEASGEGERRQAGSQQPAGVTNGHQGGVASSRHESASTQTASSD